jgi:hypothetical protein
VGIPRKMRSIWNKDAVYMESLRRLDEKFMKPELPMAPAVGLDSVLPDYATIAPARMAKRTSEAMS